MYKKHTQRNTHRKKLGLVFEWETETIAQILRMCYIVCSLNQDADTTFSLELPRL